MPSHSSVHCHSLLKCLEQYVTLKTDEADLFGAGMTFTIGIPQKLCAVCL